MLRPLSSLLKNKENGLYKSFLTANRKRSVMENVRGNALSQLGISGLRDFIFTQICNCNSILISENSFSFLKED